uniref:Histidine kinase-like protein n=1 Tax=Siphoviridae sp. ctorp6 TaxID=2825673 RepID=A0A8S5PCB9_9CAUD|nr:MAG TPA: histidine kinase-like protein [Siphoviridae sp. ctorp6]
MHSIRNPATDIYTISYFSNISISHLLSIAREEVLFCIKK